jgi:hypothetical protein
MSTLYSPKIVTDGLVLHLDAANKKSYSGSGTTWTDRSGNGNNGTLINGPTFDSANGGGIEFDQTNDYVMIPNSSSIQLTANQSFTISYFINLDSITGGNAFMASVMKGTFGSSYGHLLGTNNKYLLVYTDSDSGVEQYVYNLLDDYENKWLQITQTYDGDRIYVYQNGGFYAQSGTGVQLTTNTNPLYLGSNGGSNYFLDGTMANVYLYNRALTSSEVAQNYNATKSRFGL